LLTNPTAFRVAVRAVSIAFVAFSVMRVDAPAEVTGYLN
jgi:hypothetical protein